MTAVSGIISATVTGMDNDGSINHDLTRAHIQRMKLAGVDGVFCLGTNGEFYAMNSSERNSVVETFVDELNGEVPLFAGTGAVTTAEAIQLSKDAESIGANYLSVITPYFAQASQDEIYSHFKAVADSVELPIVLYNIPIRTGNSISPVTLSRLAEVENIIAIKDSSGDFDNLKEYISVVKGSEFSVLSGNDALILPALQEGGTGGITAVTNVFPETMVEIYQAFKRGDLGKAEEAQASIAPFRACFKHGNPNTIVKFGANLVGHEVGPCRAPFNIIPEISKHEIEKTLAILQESGMK